MSKEELTEYATQLAAAGLEVWLTPTGYREGGFLTYRDPENGCWGTFQHSFMEGWQHLMPIKPSREHGSSMHLEVPGAPWTVQAARECAQPTNYNRVVGTHRNVGEAGHWLSPKAVRIEAPQHEAPEAVIVRNGASERTADELTMQFIYDAVDLGAELSATGFQDRKHLTARLASKHDPVSGSAHFEDEGDELMAKRLAEQLETDLATVPREGGSGYVVTWDDGYTIRPTCDHPTCADFDQHQEA